MPSAASRHLALKAEMHAGARWHASISLFVAMQQMTSDAFLLGSETLGKELKVMHILRCRPSGGKVPGAPRSLARCAPREVGTGSVHLPPCTRRLALGNSRSQPSASQRIASVRPAYADTAL